MNDKSQVEFFSGPSCGGGDWGKGEARLSDTNCLIIHFFLGKEVLEAGEDLGSLGLEAESSWLFPQRGQEQIRY